MYLPKISVITINLNNAEGLKKTIESVARQTYTPLEYIVIDGGSTDGSAELIKKCTTSISYSISEKDNGIYNAMNKGIRHATGEYIMFLNSGDVFSDNEIVSQLSSEANNKDIVYGDLLFLSKSDKRVVRYPGNLNFNFFVTDHNSLPHCGTLIRKSLFNLVGLYNEELTIVSDWEFFLLAINRYNVSYKHVPIIAVDFNLDGISSQSSSFQIVSKERSLVLEKYFPTFINDYVLLQKLTIEHERRRKNFLYRVYIKIVKVLSRTNLL